MSYATFALAGVKEFLLDEVSLSFVTIQNWMLIAVAILAVILILVIVSAAKNSKKSAGDKPEEKSEAEEAAIVAETEEKTTTEETSVTEQTATEEAAVSEEATAEQTEPEKEEKEVIAEEVAEIDDATVVADDGAEEKVDEVVEEKTEGAESSAEKAEIKETEPTAKREKPTKTRFGGKADEVFGANPLQKADEKKPEKEPENVTTEENAAETAKDEAAATETKDAVKSVTGKFEICNSSIGGFRYHLLANNGQLLYESRDYKTVEGCADAVAKFVNSVANGAFTVRADKFGNYKYFLKSVTSNNVIYVGESYTTKKSCLSAVESVKRFAPVSPITDATEADFQVVTTAFSIPDEVKSAVENKQGATGKWIIDRVDEEDEKSPFVFLLYANNGQLLYQSRDYKSYDNCRKGVDVFVDAVKNGYFIIDEDKFGKFKFFLRSKKTGSQAEYVGQNYTDKQSCCSSAVSVYKFALLTPINLD
ncbi:MAG: DUF1508 domain-containing protein [Christensenellales bacterium]